MALMMSENWMITDRLIDDFLHELKFEHLRLMAAQGFEVVVEADTLISYNTFCATYDKASTEFKSKCPKTLFAFSNNGLMQTRYDELSENLQKLVYYFDDYYELCYSEGDFREVISFECLLNYVQQTHLERYRSRHMMTMREFNEWTEFVRDHLKFVLNPLQRAELFVTDIIQSEILIELRNIDSNPWFKHDTLKDFKKRFRDAALQSEFSGNTGVLVKRDFHTLNVLDDNLEQPFTLEFSNRLFDYLGSKAKLAKNEEYQMDFQTFVSIRRMLFHPKAVVTRQFLFELIDIKGDGFIDIDEVHYFYNGLRRFHNQIDEDGELPFPLFEEFYVSWFDQIEPVDGCLEKKLSFDQIKNHFYGDECLMMLVNYNSLVAFDRRFELKDPTSDTIAVATDDDLLTIQLDEDGIIKESELDDLLGPAILTDKTNFMDNNNIQAPADAHSL